MVELPAAGPTPADAFEAYAAGVYMFAVSPAEESEQTPDSIQYAVELFPAHVCYLAQGQKLRYRSAYPFNLSGARLGDEITDE